MQGLDPYTPDIMVSVPNRVASEDGEYAQAFFLCAECVGALEGLSHLRAAGPLLSAVEDAYEDTMLRLQQALQSMCGAFEPVQYAKVRSCAPKWVISVKYSEN